MVPLLTLVFGVGASLVMGRVCHLAIGGLIGGLIGIIVFVIIIFATYVAIMDDDG